MNSLSLLHMLPIMPPFAPAIAPPPHMPVEKRALTKLGLCRDLKNTWSCAADRHNAPSAVTLHVLDQGRLTWHEVGFAASLRATWNEAHGSVRITPSATSPPPVVHKAAFPDLASTSMDTIMAPKKRNAPKPQKRAVRVSRIE